ncbi:cytochrome P450 [Actinoallomurus rhizosphaericola]|uniref:cytochrome P450 n=1 Tax=Actinoallomurus rhizosphaericola TaxID=2952536 RepID=UPI0020920910|nr:cytochrome P450 [Actinoallomurus rhizosphaericola]MCO5997556.1 cytochrome P450 [Actinoallomurus rhizosphaericola]
MTSDQFATGSCPAHSGLMPLYGPEFAADPAGTYAALRRYGSAAPVELAPGVPGTLVIGYQAALDVLRDPITFPKDPRRWEANVAPDCPLLPMMAYRPNSMFSDGAAHTRLRSAVTDSLARVDSSLLRGWVESNADSLIARFAQVGQADLITEYARVLPLLVLNSMFGCPSVIADRLVEGMSGIFEGTDAEKANLILGEAVMELVAYKRANPGADVTSWLMAHPAGLTDEEMLHQLVVLMGAGTEPEQDLIASTMRLLLSDDRFAADLSGGSLPIEDALDEVLWTDPPIANYAVAYPPKETNLHGVRLPADQPVVISFAAANTDPSLTSDGRAGNRAHLAWGAGPHTCPAQGHGRLIASVAVEKLLDKLPGMELAVPADRLQWRPGMFHRALTALPVRFPPVSVPAPVPAETGGPSVPPAPLAAANRPGSSGAERPRWLRTLVGWWHGQ